MPTNPYRLVVKASRETDLVASDYEKEARVVQSVVLGALHEHGYGDFTVEVVHQPQIRQMSGPRVPSGPGRAGDPVSDQYWYMRALYDRNGQLAINIGERGAVTRNPIEAIKRYTLATERRMRETYDLEIRREGTVFAVWSLPSKLFHTQAYEAVKDAQPHRMYVFTSHTWKSLIAFTLPEDTKISMCDSWEDWGLAYP